jgi:hypothetical protein
MGGYLLFAGDDYYPNGGADDFRGTYHTMQEAMRAGEHYDWAHVATVETTMSADTTEFTFFFNVEARWREPLYNEAHFTIGYAWKVNGELVPALGEGSE